MTLSHNFFKIIELLLLFELFSYQDQIEPLKRFDNEVTYSNFGLTFFPVVDSHQNIGV